MPHSSGGGSHRSGSSSHRSSRSGGSHRGSSSRPERPKKPITVSSPRRGYSRYAYYDNGNVRYKYVKDRPKSMASAILDVLLFVPFLFIGIFMMSHSVHICKSLDVNSYNSEIVIDDKIGVLSDADKSTVLKAFTEFRNKTGISCALITDSNAAWSSNYENLEKYAYDLYVNHWADEKHWLFVYTELVNSDNNSGFIDWYWEGMQGDDTDEILTEKVTNGFNDRIQRYLTTNSYSVGNAFASAVSETESNIKIGKLVIEPELFWIAFIWSFIVVVQIVSTLESSIARIRSEKSQVDKLQKSGIHVPEHPLEDTCTYCGGVYIHGVHIECPHCGAAITSMKL